MNMICWFAVDRVPEATTDCSHLPLVCSVRPVVPPTACAVISARISQQHVTDAVGASVGHGVARVVPMVPGVGFQINVIATVAAEVVATVPAITTISPRPMPPGTEEKKFAGTIARGTDVFPGAVMIAFEVNVFFVTAAGSEYSSSVWVPV